MTAAAPSGSLLTIRHSATFRRRLVLVAVGGAALFFTGLRLSGAAAPVEASGAAALPVSTVVAAPVTSYTRVRAFTGVIRPRRAVDLAFERAGEVTAVGLCEGDAVPAGGRVATLDTRRLEADQQALAARRAQAAAVLAELRAGARPETLAAARAEVRALAAQVEQLRRKRARRDSLLARGVITPEERDEVAYALRAEEARREAARRRLDELEAGTRAERVTAQEAEVARLDAEVRRLAIEVEESALRAPFAARVSAVRVDPGAVVAAGQPIVRLVEDAPPEAWVGVPPAVRRPRLGERYPLRVGGRELTGRLTAVLPELDGATRTATWVLALEGPAAPDLLTGQVVRLTLREAVAGEGVWLPLTALARGERDVWSCFVVRPDIPRDSARDSDGSGEGVVERRLVEPLYVEAERVLARGTLERGERVVARGTHRLVPGQRVQCQEQRDSERELAPVAVREGAQ